MDGAGRPIRKGWFGSREVHWGYIGRHEAYLSAPLAKRIEFLDTFGAEDLIKFLTKPQRKWRF